MRELAWEHRELVGEHFKDISNFFREHAPPNAPDAPGSMLPRGGGSMLPQCSLLLPAARAKREYRCANLGFLFALDVFAKN